MRTNFYICWGNRDKYFDWRLKTGKFNTKQQNTDTKVRPQTWDTTSPVSFKIQLRCFLLSFHFYTRTRYCWYQFDIIDILIERMRYIPSWEKKIILQCMFECLFPWNRYRCKLITISDLWGRTLQFLIENLIWPARPGLLVTRLWLLWGDPCISRYSEMWISFNLFWVEGKAWT